MLVCLLAVWAAVIAAEKGSLKHLILAAALIGVGFNIKMLQAFLYLPAIYLVYFFTAKTKWTTRLWHLAVATGVLLVLSLSWCVIVDLTPADSRPYIGSSQTNSAIELAFGYNGLSRLLGAVRGGAGSGMVSALTTMNGGAPNEGGDVGVLRLFNADMAAQASWLLVPALFGLLALLYRTLTGKDKERATRRAASAIAMGRSAYADGCVFQRRAVFSTGIISSCSRRSSRRLPPSPYVRRCACSPVTAKRAETAG